ncbi:MAG: signal peptidase I [Candidatus Doudnabacteria bacterium]
MQTDLEQQNTENQENESGLKELGLFAWDLIKVLIIAMAIILPIRYAVAQPFIVSGSSMEPTFYTGEYLIINEWTYHFDNPQRGDVIVFKYPKDTSQYFIKRVIALPGERVKIEENKVIIYNKEHPNGWVLGESYIPASDTTLPVGDGTTTLGSDEYYVLGDNRLASSDSRFWGPVPKHDIIGKVFIRAFPFSDLKKFETIEYGAK